MPDPTDARPDYSNVVSGSSSAAPSPQSAAAGASKGEPRFYVVERGDNLSKIAKKFYGDMNQWKRIFDANHDVIRADMIQPGWRLRIPE